MALCLQRMLFAAARPARREASKQQAREEKRALCAGPAGMPTTAKGAGAAKRASRAELAKPESALHFLGLTAASERLQQLKKGHATAPTELINEILRDMATRLGWAWDESVRRAVLNKASGNAAGKLLSHRGHCRYSRKDNILDRAKRQKLTPSKLLQRTDAGRSSVRGRSQGAKRHSWKLLARLDLRSQLLPASDKSPSWELDGLKVVRGTFAHGE